MAATVPAAASKLRPPNSLRGDRMGRLILQGWPGRARLGTVGDAAPEASQARSGMGILPMRPQHARAQVPLMCRTWEPRRSDPGSHPAPRWINRGLRHAQADEVASAESRPRGAERDRLMRRLGPHVTAWDAATGGQILVSAEFRAAGPTGPGAVHRTPTVRRVAEPLRLDGVPPRRAERSGTAGDLARPVAELRRGPARLRGSASHPPSVRPRHHPLRPGQQLRTAIRRGRGNFGQIFRRICGPTATSS